MKSIGFWNAAGKLGCICALTLLSSWESPGATSRAGEGPDPMVLLHGVEDARAAIPAGYIDWTVKHEDPTQPRSGVHVRRVRVAMDGDKRRYDQEERILMYDMTKPGSQGADRKLRAMGGDQEAFVKAGLGEFKDVHTNSAFDGERYMQYGKELGGAYILDPNKGSLEYIFDPRVFGLTFWYTFDDTVTGDLGYRDGKSVTLLGREDVGGRSTWHVVVVDKSDRERHFWIDPEDFRVLKGELRSPYSKVVSECVFNAGSAYPQLPSEVVLSTFNRKQVLTGKTTFHVDRAVVGAVDPAGWTLAGLGTPLGQAVFDNRVRKVVGNFDGEGLTQGVIPAIEKGRASENGNRKAWWAAALVGLIALAAASAILVKKRNLLNEGGA